MPSGVYERKGQKHLAGLAAGRTREVQLRAIESRKKTHEARRELQFWLKVQRHPTDCWPWLGPTDEKGYGFTQAKIDGKTYVGAHRIAFRYANGAITSDKPCICHTCDNEPCCRPSHMFAGTSADNNRDRHTKGRSNLEAFLAAAHKLAKGRKESAETRSKKAISMRRAWEKKKEKRPL